MNATIIGLKLNDAIDKLKKQITLWVHERKAYDKGTDGYIRLTQAITANVMQVQGIMTSINIMNEEL